MIALHDDHLSLDTELVRQLVRRSFPEYTDRAIAPLESSGSTNALYRLGKDLLVRLPRQPGGSAEIDKEARWLPFVASHLTVPVPEVVGVGEPAFGYPERWSITRWLDGDTPDVPWDPKRGSSAALATGLGSLVRELRSIPVPQDAINDPDLRWYRGGSLADADGDFRQALAQCRELPGIGLDLGRAEQVWEEAVALDASTADSAARTPRQSWYHGDLFAENLLVREGRLTAVLDAGGLGVGDPTIDLLVGFEVPDADGLQRLRDSLEATDDEWTRAKGWALYVAIVTFPSYFQTMPTRCAHRRVLAAAALRDDDPSRWS